jgi:hypothetical protein
MLQRILIGSVYIKLEKKWSSSCPKCLLSTMEPCQEFNSLQADIKNSEKLL